MEKLRILYLTTNFGKGGAERFLIDLATELQNRENVEFVIGSLFNYDLYNYLTEQLPIVQLNYQTYSFRNGNECKPYKKLIDSFKPHIIHTHRFLAEFLSSYYIYPNIKYVCHGHDNMVQLKKPTIKSFFNRRLFLDVIERQILINKKYKKVVTHFIANSRHTQGFYLNTLPSKSKHEVHFIQYGFNFTRFFKDDINYIGENEKIKIINVGSFQPKKNQKFIVEIAKALMNYTTNFEVHLLGDGELREAVERLVEKQQLHKYFVFHGNVDRVEEHLHKSHFYLHTAWYEPFGLVFLEAMAAGLPVVCLDGKGNRDLIEPEKNGFIFYDEKPNKFAEKIWLLAKEKEMYKRISKYAKSYAQKFDISSKTDELLEFYRKIINE